VAGLILVGAGPGLGASLARRFGAGGLGVSLVSRDAETLDRVAATLTTYAVEVATYAADAGQPDQLRAALGAAVADHGVPDVVVYNAAVIRADSPGDLSPEELAATWAVNVSGALVTALATLPAMADRGSGTMLATGGMPRPDASRLSLSLGKAGLRALTTMLAQQFGPRGVHVAPGTTYDPDAIAEEYWRLHHQAPAEWETEVVYDGRAGR
jgi:NAD(P)-dependent dehydrogenase (short-subunit alcohol dehydrogenase family)